MKYRLTKSPSWWSLAFAINFLFQIYRGSGQDQIIFTIALVLIFLESTNYLDWIPEFKWLRTSKINIWVLTLVSIYIFFSKPDTGLTAFIFTLLFIFFFFDLWRREDGDRAKMSGKEIGSAKIWAGIGIALCIWELLAFVLATIYKDDYSYPTVSVIFEPYLTQPFFRGIFVICWSAIGYVLIKDWREPK